jgi:ATP synthase protein I
MLPAPSAMDHAMARAYQPMNERDKPDSLRDLDDRLRRLREREGSDRAKPDRRGSTSSGLGMAMRIGVELVAALLVGVGIGWLLDYWLETTIPWFSLVGFFFGAAAGMMNIYRVMMGMNQTVGYSGQRAAKDDESPPDTSQ